MKITFLGLTITSSWGNGHATTYRSLLRALHRRGHRLVFLEKDVDWYRGNRDLPGADYCDIVLYRSWKHSGRALALRHADDSDVVVIGSYFPDAIEATRSLLESSTTPLTFYDIDTPVTLAQLRREGRTDYLEADLIPLYAAYMSFTGGPALRELMTRFGSPLAVPLYCSVDPDRHHRTASRSAFGCDLSYLGTYAADRQPKLETLLQAPARHLPDKRFLVAGPQYPADISWASNVRRLTHVPPSDHPSLYSSARFVLNITREDMVAAGYSPSVRLFEASACAAPIISDSWPGIGSFFQPGEEILLAASTEEVLSILTGISGEQARQIGVRARERVLSAHTADRRAREFEEIVEQIGSRPADRPVLPRDEAGTDAAGPAHA